MDMQAGYQAITALVALLSAAFNVNAMEPLNESQLGNIIAREGVAVNFDFLINADITSDGTISPIPCPDGAEHANGTPDCRLALKFNDIDSAWLILKDYQAAFSLKKALVDSERTDDSSSGLCDADCQARYPVGFNANDIPVLQISYDHSDIGINASWYGDAHFYINVGRIAAEFGPTGFFDDATPGSVLGLRMADGPDAINGAARMRFDGRMPMYGF